MEKEIKKVLVLGSGAVSYTHLGEQISYFIYFDVDPANIDVNIHPTKTEIKFENEQAIWLQDETFVRTRFCQILFRGKRTELLFCHGKIRFLGFRAGRPT